MGRKKERSLAQLAAAAAGSRTIMKNAAARRAAAAASDSEGEVAVDAQQECPVTVRVDNLAALDLLTLCGCHWSDGAARLSRSLSQCRSASHLPLACSYTTVVNMHRNGFELLVRSMDAPMPLVASDPHGRTGRWSVCVSV